MRVVLLHPPFYLSNYSLYHELGKLVDLTCYVFGDAPVEHPSWNLAQHYRPEEHAFRVRQLGSGSYPRAQIYSGNFLRYLKKDRPDVVLTLAFAPYGFYAACYKKYLGYRIFLMTDATAVSDGNIPFLKRLSRNLLLRCTDGGLSASPATSAYLQSLAPNLPLTLAIQTVDVRFFQAHAAPYWQQSCRQLRQLLGQKFANGSTLDFLTAPLILGVGRFVLGKGWEDGLAHLYQIPDLHYVLVGTGPEEQKYRDIAEDLGVSRRLHILPFASPEELVLYYCASDLFFFPSRSETFGFVLAEALACGLPVLCTSGVGAQILIEEGKTGWCYPVGQVPSSTKFQQYCAQARTMKAYCRGFMQEHSHAQRVAKIFQALQQN